MIKLQSLNKYYSRGSANELHVINDTTLELPSSGLVSFLGKSGCGKTTLLNAIGGLDSFDGGSISYDGEEMKKYSMKEADKYRREHIGYIFQNYLLLENKSIYENLRIALENIEVTDEEEQQKRIKYVLTAVGMYKFRKKPAGNLSGGQMQRVSIARALLKECKVIIADEPTGNLDSQNTIEVMNILKKISKKTLVLLVTHNREIADFYSDRVIEIKDGKIIADHAGSSSYGEESAGLDVKNEKQIYLKDLKKEEAATQGEELKINFYTADDQPRKIELNIVVKGNSVYVDSAENLVVVKDGNVQLIDDHYKAIKKEDVNEFDFDIAWYDNTKKTAPLKRFFSSFKSAMRNFWRVPVKKRVFQFIFAFIGLMMGVCMIAANQYGSIDVSGSSNEAGVYCLTDQNSKFGYYTMPSLTQTKVTAAIDSGYIEDVYNMYYTSGYVSYYYNTIHSLTHSEDCYLYPYSKISANHALLAGMAPSNNTEIVLSKTLADNFLKAFDFSSYADLIGLRMNEGGIYTICGVVDIKTNSAYALSVSAGFYQPTWYESNSISYESKKEIQHKAHIDYTLSEGRDIQTENEILLNAEQFSDIELGTKVTAEISAWGQYSANEYNKTYTVVGKFTSKEEATFVICSDTAILGGTFYNDPYYNDPYIYVYHYYYKSAVYSISDFTGEADTAVEGSRMPSEDKNEALVNLYSGYAIGDKVDGTSIQVVGYFYSEDESTINNIYLTHSAKMYYIVQNASAYDKIYYRIKEGAEKDLATLGIKIYTPAQFDYEYMKNGYRQDMLISLVIALILLAFTIIYVYFSTRSRLIMQIKSVGIYRCIGASRWQIIKKYMTDILVETTFTTLIGYLIVVGGYAILYNAFADLSSGLLIALNPLFCILGGIVLFAVNLVFGLLPVFMLLRKTPAEINSKYDI